MTTYIIKTKSGTIWILTHDPDKEFWGLGSNSAGSSVAKRFLGTRFEIQEPLPFPPEIGKAMVLYGADKNFPSSTGWVATSRVIEVQEIA